MNKKFFKPFFAALLAMTVGLLPGCDDDDPQHADVDGRNPVVEMKTDHIRAEAGRQFAIEGRIEDPDGIRSVRIACEALALDRTIDLFVYHDELLYVYELDYAFTVPQDNDADEFRLDITATDVGGRSTTQSVRLTMDGDFVAPAFPSAPESAVTVMYAVEDTEATYRLSFTATDDKALDRVTVAIPSIDYARTVRAERTELVFDERIAFPAEERSHEITLTAVDRFDHATVRTVQLTVMPEKILDYQKMYLADVDTAADLTSDLLGVPMLIDRTAPYTYRARYYAARPGVGIRFIPQKTDFAPINFGVDPDSPTRLTGTRKLTQPIVLPEKGYYQIDFNTETMQFTVTPYTPDTQVYDQIGTREDLGDGYSQTWAITLAANGLPGYSWACSNGDVLLVDSENPYVLYHDFDLTAGTDIQFIICKYHVWNWWPNPFWRWTTDEAEANVADGGTDMKAVTVVRSGKYRLRFDYHLLRTEFVFVE